MEKKLKLLLDYQRFEPSERLSALIAETEARYGAILDEDALAFVNAAGEVNLPKKRQDGLV